MSEIKEAPRNDGTSPSKKCFRPCRCFTTVTASNHLTVHQLFGRRQLFFLLQIAPQIAIFDRLNLLANQTVATRIPLLRASKLLAKRSFDLHFIFFFSLHLLRCAFNFLSPFFDIVFNNACKDKVKTSPTTN